MRRLFEWLFRKFRPKTNDEDMISIVLLLREPEIFLEWQYVAAIKKSWGPSEENHAVVQGPLAFLRIDAILVSVACGSRPYWTSKKTLPEWAYHEAFITVNHNTPPLGTKARYAVIARFVLALLTENCVAAFSPELGGLARNDESLVTRLRAMAVL